MKEDFEYIKKNYGENIAKLCREIVPELFEQKTLVPRLLLACFAPHDDLYKDMITFGKYNIRNYMYSRINRKQEKFTTDKRPRELLKEVGYSLFVCTSPEDILYFKNSYDPDELLCTYRDGVESRFQESYYFFLYKDNFSSLRRNDFKAPDREDEYSKSLICLQINRNYHNVRMTSRYNHGVNFSDSMFSNNLDNIIPGLCDAFEKEFHIKISQREFVDLSDLQSLQYLEYGPNQTLYKFNEYINGKFYCPNNIVLEEGQVHQLQKDHQVLLDYYVIDYKDRLFFTYDESIPDSIHAKKFQKCVPIYGKDLNTFQITFEDGSNMIIASDKMDRIHFVTDNESTSIGDHFFDQCRYISGVTMTHVREVGDNFLSSSLNLEDIHMPMVEEVGSNFVFQSPWVSVVCMDYLRKVGRSFFEGNTQVRDLYLPSLVSTGDNFFLRNKDMKQISLPNVQYLGSDSFGGCTEVEKLSIPNLTGTGGDCFSSDYTSYAYVEEILEKNRERGDIDELDMEQVQSNRHSR